MGTIVREGSENLTGGEVNSLPPHLVGTNEAISTQDLDPRDFRGATTRNGRSKHGVNNGSDSAVDGIKSWVRDNATAYVIARVGTTFYDASAAAWASLGIGGTSGKVFQAAALNDVLAIVVDGLAPRKYDGTTFAALGGTPPANAKYASVHVSKLWLAGDPANPQKKSFSATNNPEDFTAANDAGSITSQDGGGDTIQGMASNRLVLLTFYRHFTDVLTGNSVANFREERLQNKGLVSETGHVTAGDIAFFASDDAIYMVAGTRVSDITTLKFKEVYQDISDKGKISLGFINDLLLVVDYGADKAYACDYKRLVWSTWTGQAWKVMDTGKDNTLYAGADGGSTTQIWKLDTGSLDGTATVTAKWRTPNLGFGWPDAIKNLAAVKVHAKPGIGTVTVTYYKNGVSKGSTTDLTFASTGDHDWAGRHGQSKMRGHYLGFEYSWAGLGTLYGWTVYAEVTTDNGQIPVEV